MRRHDNALGPIDHFARFQRIFELFQFVLQSLHFLPTGERNFNRGKKLAFLYRLYEIPQNAGVLGLIHNIGLAEGRQQDYGRNFIRIDFSRRGNAVHFRHFNIHQNQIRAVLAGQFHGPPAIYRLAHDFVTRIFEHFPDIQTDKGFVIGNDNP